MLLVMYNQSQSTGGGGQPLMQAPPTGNKVLLQAPQPGFHGYQPPYNPPQQGRY